MRQPSNPESNGGGRSAGSSQISDRFLGLFFLFFAIATIFVWIPLDVDSGIVETVRRRLIIGDSLGPVVAGLALAVGGLLTALTPKSDAVSLTRSNFAWIACLAVLIALSLSVVRFSGPVIAGLIAEGGYRPLRDTIPWKYIGHLLGGTLLVSALTGLTVRQFSWGRLAVGFLAALAIALVFDLPFEDLLLPPNGDV